ncbi:hypothetical protein KFE25_006030 [Diacronema lutheri]|uniref:Uncharacterized protein n=1 Tax=Diacronema lutheri TaxID=2081491 RepID=A0A8J5XX56_DIALT|nr:hypothetical protein KFE25_006030 [Diacronema lutheri]
MASRIRAMRALRAVQPIRRLSTPAGDGKGEQPEVTFAIGRIIKFGFVLSTVGLVVSYGSVMDLGATRHALVLASARDPFFQTTGSRRLRAYANNQRKCTELVDNGAIELLCAHLASEDDVVRLEATETINALCRGPCAEQALARYQRASSAPR